MHHEGCKKITFCIQIFKGSPIGRSSFLDELCQYVVRIARANFFDRHFFIRHFFMFVVGFVFFANETIRIYWIYWSRTEHTVWRLGPYLLMLSVYRPHRSTMQYAYRRGLSLQTEQHGLFVCLSWSWAMHKTDEPIEMPFGLQSNSRSRVGHRNHVFNGAQIPHEKGQFWGGRGGPL